MIGLFSWTLNNPENNPFDGGVPYWNRVENGSYWLKELFTSYYSDVTLVGDYLLLFMTNSSDGLSNILSRSYWFVLTTYYSASLGTSNKGSTMVGYSNNFEGPYWSTFTTYCSTGFAVLPTIFNRSPYWFRLLRNYSVGFITVFLSSVIIISSFVVGVTGTLLLEENADGHTKFVITCYYGFGSLTTFELILVYWSFIFTNCDDKGSSYTISSTTPKMSHYIASWRFVGSYILSSSTIFWRDKLCLLYYTIFCLKASEY